jgi:CRP-like cAMP-binding protein
MIFAQGDPAMSVMYVENGAVRLSVLSHAGRAAVVAVLDAGHFFGAHADDIAPWPLRRSGGRSSTIDGQRDRLRLSSSVEARPTISAICRRMNDSAVGLPASPRWIRCRPGPTAFPIPIARSRTLPRVAA